MINRVLQPINNTLGFLRLHKELTLIVFFSFFIRFALSGWNSYWLDELYSVFTYGISHSSIIDMARYLGTTSIHPPLYQVILYYWMEVFGHYEVATRSLSIVYVTLAIIFLYLTIFRLFGKRVAIIATLLFTTTYSAIYYSLETRSYAQSLFLVTLSSYFLVNYLLHIQNRFQFKALFINWQFFWLIGANSALIMTHYYNIFFLAAQGTFLLFWFIWHHPRKNILPHIIYAGIPYLISLSAFLIIWGRFFLSRASIRREAYSVDEISLNPFEMFNRMALTNNFSLSNIIYLIIAIFFIYIIWNKLSQAYQSRKNGEAPKYKNLFYLYIIIWAFLPFFYTYVGFMLISFERYLARYFIFVIPAIVVILAICIEELFRYSDQLFNKYTGKSHIFRFYQSNVILVAVFAVLILTLFGGYKAATTTKHDWRALSASAANVVQSNPENNYIIYETSWRNYSLAEYYLSRGDNNVEVHGLIRRSEERSLERGEDYRPVMLRRWRTINEYDYLIILFIHHRPQDFPHILELVEAEYPIHYKQLSPNGRGFIVYQIPKDEDES